MITIRLFNIIAQIYNIGDSVNKKTKKCPCDRGNLTLTKTITRKEVTCTVTLRMIRKTKIVFSC